MTPRRSLWLWAALLLAAAIVTAAILVPRHALHLYRAQLRAAGVRLTLEELASPKLPEYRAAAQEFLATSNALTRAGQVSLLSVPPAMSMVAPGTAVPGWRWPKLLPPDRKQDPNYLQQLRKRYGLRNAALPHEQAPSAEPAWEDLAAELQSRAAALTSIRKVCQTTALEWDTDFSNGFSARLPHLGVCKTAVQPLLSTLLLRVVGFFAVFNGIEGHVLALDPAHALTQGAMNYSKIHFDHEKLIAYQPRNRS